MPKVVLNSMPITRPRLLPRRIVPAGRDRDAAHQLAQELKYRFVQFEALYSTIHDVLIVCGEANIHPGYLKPSMTVMDLSSPLQPSSLLREAPTRGCAEAMPRQVWLEQVALQTHLLTGKVVPRQLLEEAAPWLREED
jgi:shikimate 5-dehydrogenase